MVVRSGLICFCGSDLITSSGNSGRTILSLRVILVGNWNAVLGPDLDRIYERSCSNKPNVKPFQDIVDKLDLVDKNRNEHPRGVV